MSLSNKVVDALLSALGSNEARVELVNAVNAGSNGVLNINGINGPVTLAAGSNITLTPSGNTLTIAASSGGSGIPSPMEAITTFDTQGNSTFGVPTPFIGVVSDLSTSAGGIFYGSTDTSGSVNGSAQVNLITGTVTGNNSAGSGSLFIGTGNGGSSSGPDGNVTIAAGNGAIMQLIGSNQGANSSTIQMSSNVGMNSLSIANMADPINPQDAATKAYVDANSSGQILTFLSTAVGAGAADAAVTVTGLLASDTILSITQQVRGATTAAFIGWTSVVDGGFTGHWSADPGGTAQLLVAVKR